MCISPRERRNGEVVARKWEQSKSFDQISRSKSLLYSVTGKLQTDDFGFNWDQMSKQLQKGTFLYLSSSFETGTRWGVFYWARSSLPFAAAQTFVLFCLPPHLPPPSLPPSLRSTHRQRTRIMSTFTLSNVRLFVSCS